VDEMFFSFFVIYFSSMLSELEQIDWID